MSENKAPLFNRTYLKAVVWIIAITVVLLNAGSSGPDFLTIERSEQAPVYAVDVDDSPYLQIELMFRLDPAIHPQQALLNQLLSAQVSQQLIGFTARPEAAPLQPRLNSQLQDDRLTLQLAIPSRYQAQQQDIATLINALLTQLHNSPVLDREKTWRTLEARQYIQQKSQEQQLLNAFTATIQPLPDVHPLQRFDALYRHHFSADNLIIALQGEDASDLLPLLSQQLAPISAGVKPVSDNHNASYQVLAAQSNEHYRLAGINMAGRQSDDFPAQLLAVKTLEQLLKDHSDTDYRLSWKALDKHGYLAIILHGAVVRDEASLANAFDQLRNSISDSLIEQTREQVRAHFEAQMEQPESQLHQLSNIAFYNLPLDYLAQFDQQLASTDNARVQTELRRLLNLNQLHQIYQPAY